MKQSSLLALVMVATLAGASAAATGEPVNILGNGGFEEGLAGWSPDAKHERLVDAAAAHSGEACLSGTVTGPRQALRLKRTVEVKEGNRYRFEIWARATNRTKLVLFSYQPRSTVRQMVTSWPDVPGKWRKYSIPLAVQGTGKLTLEIIAPSSFGEPAGQIWIDDVAVLETEMPPVTSVSEDEGFSDEPAMARAGDGSFYVAYNGFRDGADSLQLGRLALEGKDFRTTGSWQLLGGQGTYLLGPRVVAAGDRVFVLYAAEVEGNWDVYAAPCGADGPGEPVRITSDEAADIKPAAVWSDDALWIAWESNRSAGRQILAASLVEGKVSDPQPLSPAGAASYSPSMAALESGEVCVAWHAFDEHNYDLYLSRRSAAGKWTSPVRLTKAPAIDRHPVLCSLGDELWVVYENATTERYNLGRTNRRQLVAAKITTEGLKQPRLAPGGPYPLGPRCEGAAAALDENGRLWVALLKPRLPRTGWDVFLTCLTGDRWYPLAPVSVQKGMDRPPSLVLDGGRAVIAYQTDDLPRSWGDVDQTPQAKSNVMLAAVDLELDAAPGAIRVEPLVESDRPRRDPRRTRRRRRHAVDRVPGQNLAPLLRRPARAHRHFGLQPRG